MTWRVAFMSGSV